jgi:hypothetical protein
MAMDTTVVNPTIHVMKVLLRIGNLDPWFRWFNAHADAEMNVPVAVSAAVPLRNFITIDENYAPIYHVVQEVSASGAYYRAFRAVISRLVMKSLGVVPAGSAATILR